MDGRRGGGIDDSKVGGFLTTNDGCVSARGEKERGEEGFKTAKSIPRDESNVNLSGYFVRGVKPWRKMAGGWVTSSPAFSLHGFAKEMPTIYFRFRIFPMEGGIKSRIRSLICYPYPIFSFSSSTRLFETKFAIFNIVVSRQSISKQFLFISFLLHSFY